MAKTALQSTHEELKQYIRVASQRALPVPSLDAKEKSNRLLERAKKVAAILKSQFGVRRVILFGSLAAEPWNGVGSDIDLAIEGLEKASYWEAWRVTEEEMIDYPVDLVEIESASESLQRAIERYGIEL
ncbi:MAG: nucleotidyltransferase domain-containing protein [Deltaproteobacteria bacterium]|nr:nucleotidyltransferase domain-containing protein [Deltaproteobacteria bacterium]